uniref:Tenascin-R n=1 Tax=Ceratitis capitata TaxID=7213 RepID=W8BYD3_CERCA
MTSTPSTFFIYLLTLIIVWSKPEALTVGENNVYTILYGNEATISGLQREVRIIQQKLQEHRRSLNNLHINYATLLKRFDDLEKKQKHNLEDNLLPKIQRYIEKKLRDQTTDILQAQRNYQKALQSQVDAQRQTFNEEFKIFETKLLKRVQSELPVDSVTSKPDIAELTPFEYLKNLENNAAELKNLPKNAIAILEKIINAIECIDEDVSAFDRDWPAYTSFLPTKDDKSVAVNARPPTSVAGKIPSSCDEAIKMKDATANDVGRGIYTLDLTLYNLSHTFGYCLPDPNGGEAWLLIQRRINDKLSFHRNWQDYRNGFGNLAESFFFGLEKIYRMSRERNLELWIQLGISTTDSSPHVEYRNFAISNEADKYQLKIANIGTEGEVDDLTDAQDFDFQTFDRGDSEKKNCADDLRSGWWYDVSRNNGVCDNGNLNRKLADIHWNNYDKIIYVHMAIRPTKRDVIVKGKIA